MNRTKGIIAYGTDEDRQKLALLARLGHLSSSEWLIQTIREAYTAAFGSELIHIDELTSTNE